MKSIVLVLLPLIFLSHMGFAQLHQKARNNQIIEGYIYDSESNLPLSYASIFVPETGNGTISNVDGYFMLNIDSVINTIVISYLGYHKVNFNIISDKNSIRILLKRNSTELDEVVVTPDNEKYLYKLLRKCAQKNYYKEEVSKAYFELKTFADSAQVELVEGFYNVLSKGYDPIELDLKAGRLAVQEHSNRLFLSLESSRAVIGLKMSGNNQFFPENPVGMSLRKMIKTYNLEVKSKYYNDKKQLIFILQYSPKQNVSNYFEGEIWIDVANFNILKMTYQCKKAQVHPFLPLWPNYVIKQVDFNITKTFESRNGQMFFKHIDFCYDISHVDSNDNLQAYSTSAILYAYDSQNKFSLHKFQFSSQEHSDFRKISAFPYNDFFWKNNNELRLHTKLNENNAFYNSAATLRGESLFHKIGKSPTGDLSKHSYVMSKSIGPFEHPYILYHGQRVIFKEEQTSKKKNIYAAYDTQNFGLDKFNLSIKIFMDLDSYNDSVNVVTSTVLDPFESYYYGPIGNENICFINIYFDIVEIERQRLEKEILRSDRKINTINNLYIEATSNLANIQKQYYRETMHGTNLKALYRWNIIVKEKLGVDNFSIFKVEGGKP